MLNETLAAIRPLDDEAIAAARALQARLTKPMGSLGALEVLAVRLAGLAGACPPPIPEPAALAIFAGDHGVHDQGVTPWPQQAAATGLGTGINSETHARKVAVVTSAVVGLDADDPIDILAAVGGLEHAALAGFILRGAALRVPVILDGVIAAAAALAAAALAPDSVVAMVAGHRSAEPGATVALGYLELEPLVDLGLRLGEGTGAVLALPIVASAVRVLHEVATFDSAGVAHK